MVNVSEDATGTDRLRIARSSDLTKAVDLRPLGILGF